MFIYMFIKMFIGVFTNVNTAKQSGVSLTGCKGGALSSDNGPILGTIISAC